MNAIEVQTHARKLFSVHGPKALAEATANVRQFEQRGDVALAKDWKLIEAALRNLQGPVAS